MHVSVDCPWSERGRLLLDAFLSPEEREHYERHLESCPTCQDHIDRPEEGDKELLDDLLELMAGERADMTIAFRALAAFDRGAGATPSAFRDHFIDRAAADAWGERYLRRLEAEPRADAARHAAMNRANPKFVLRNHLAQEAIAKAEAGDFSEVRALHELLRRPYDEQPGHERYAALPPDWARGIEVSCSS